MAVNINSPRARLRPCGQAGSAGRQAPPESSFNSATVAGECSAARARARGALDRVSGGDNLLRIGIRDLDRKLVLEGHDDLDCVQAVQAEVIHEV